MSFTSVTGVNRERGGACRKPCPPPCPVGPVVPEQGGVMPVLWQPTVQTTPGLLAPSEEAQFTLNMLSTQWISRGILLRFQMWNGLDLTYSGAIATNQLVEWDLIVRVDIPPGTLLVVSMRETSTGIWGYTGPTVYASGGAGIPVPFFQRGNSLLCLAMAPTPTGAWAPQYGEPMFAIGFNYPPLFQMSGCGASEPLGAQITAPNFPDQYADLVDGDRRFDIKYEVVYPQAQPYMIFGDTDWICVTVTGIKFQTIPTYPVGSWTNARDVIAQPWTYIKENIYSVNSWTLLSAQEAVELGITRTPDVGPLTLVPMAGQLVPVYWQPRYKDINTDTTPISTGPLVTDSATLALLVTSPMQPHMAVYFTNDQFDAQNGGFGPRNATTGEGRFLNMNPSFVWTAGARVIPAGTVIYISNIGADAGPIYVQDAHLPQNDVGSITYNRINGQAVTSLIGLGVWSQFLYDAFAARPLDASMFVCAALSDQYAGNFPLLAPCVTIHKTRFFGQVIYGRNKIISGKDLPGTVWAPMINSADFTLLEWNTGITPADMPVFVNMCDFAW